MSNLLTWTRRTTDKFGALPWLYLALWAVCIAGFVHGLFWLSLTALVVFHVAVVAIFLGTKEQ
jgi:hypothetical protein